MKRLLISGSLFFIICVILYMTVFYVDQTEYALVLRFGEFKKAIMEPGIYFKLPDPIEEVKKLDNRVLDYDSLPTEIITKDKKNLVVDNFSKWKITDPYTFYKKVFNEAGMNDRLDSIVYSSLRESLGKHEFIEIVSSKRESIMENVTKHCNDQAKQYGIEIIDVRIKRADLPEENEDSVYQRMKTEREKEATLYRSEGKKEATKIRSEVDKRVQMLKAQAYKKSQANIGKAEEIAIKIYAGTYNGMIEDVFDVAKDENGRFIEDYKNKYKSKIQEYEIDFGIEKDDQETMKVVFVERNNKDKDTENFFYFLKRLELIEDSFDKDTKIIMSTSGELFNILNSID